MVTHAGGKVTVAEAAVILQKHDRTVRRYITEGALPVERDRGGRILIATADLEALGAEVKPPDPIREAALRVVEQAPELTPEQLAGICNLLRGVA